MTPYKASIVNIGQLLGSPLSGLLANVWGRKKAILLTNTVSGLGWVIVAASFSDVAAISVGRFLSGFGIVTSVIQVIKVQVCKLVTSLRLAAASRSTSARCRRSSVAVSTAPWGRSESGDAIIPTAPDQIETR